MNAAETTPELISGKRFAPVHLGRVLVVGLGKSGKAAVAYCAAELGRRVDALTVSAGARTADAEAFVASFAKRGIDFRFEYEDIEGHFDLCIISPGVPDISKLYRNAKAAADELVSELEFAWRESDASSKWIAISGTNGKTTTTSLATHILVSAGLRAYAVGNIGEVALTCVWKNPQDIYVAEISSFQLATTSRFAPDVAVMLNITPDHVEWHGSMERYVQAKARLFARADAAGEGATAIFDCENAITASLCRDFAARARNTRIVCLMDAAESPAEAPCGPYGAVAVADGHLRVSGVMEADFGPQNALQIKGVHNAVNALAAACAASAVGVASYAIASSLATFAPLEHRIEPCGVFDGVSYFNDSKGTNVDSTVKAVSAFPAGTVICLLGGHDKGTELAPLVDACRAGCKAVVCYGEARERFLAAFGAEGLAIGGSAICEGLRVMSAKGMREAARMARAAAGKGDTVLLSPACSSFDEFTGYGERGRVFKALVAEEFGGNGC